MQTSFIAANMFNMFLFGILVAGFFILGPRLEE